MKKSELKISPAIIWISSLVLGILSSVPQLAQSHFNAAEAAVNAGITATFALLMWYVNIFMLATRPPRLPKQRISHTQLVGSLGVGIALMFVLAWIQQLLLSHLPFGPVMLMVEIQGILIHLVFYMLISQERQDYSCLSHFLLQQTVT